MIISMREVQTYLKTFVHDHDGFVELLLYYKISKVYLADVVQS